MLIFAVFTVFSLWCGFLALALLTTGPTTLTDRGITQGGRPPYYREIFVPWNDVARVSCRFSRRIGRIGQLEIFSNDEEKIVLGRSAVSLEDVRAFITRHVPPGTLQPCK